MYHFVLLLAVFIASGLVSCTSINGSNKTISMNKDYELSVDSLAVRFEDDTTHALTLHRGDVFHVDRTDSLFYYAHVGDHIIKVPVSASTLHIQQSNTTSSTSTGATGNGQTIKTGSRGGQYYINSNGNKTYIKKKEIGSTPPPPFWPRAIAVFVIPACTRRQEL